MPITTWIVVIILVALIIYILNPKSLNLRQNMAYVEEVSE